MPRRDRDRNAEGRPESARPRDRFGAPLPRADEDQLPDRVPPEDVCTEVGPAFDEAVRLWSEERFFESHEYFEWIWKSGLIDADERAFFKGLAQVAVGYTHCQRGNAKGSVTLLERGARAVAAYAADHRGVDVSRLVADARAFAAESEELGVGPERDFPAFPHG